MYCFPLEIQQLWKRSKFNESINAPKIEYNLRNMKDYENQSATTKRGHSQKYCNCCRFFNKNGWWRSKTKRRHLQKPYNYCRFWRILMVTRVEERWRSSTMWILARTCDKNEAPAMKGDHDGVRNCEFPGGHSNILKSAESRMWTAPQFHWRTPTSSARGQTCGPQGIKSA